MTAPFSAALVLTDDGEGCYLGELGPHWTVGDRAHGGILLGLLARATLDELSRSDTAEAPDPLVVSAEFLAAPAQGPVLLRTNVVKRGGTASVVTVALEQRRRVVLTGTVTAGRLPTAEPTWSWLPELPAEPPSDALDPSADPSMAEVFRLSRFCDVRLDRATVAFPWATEPTAGFRPTQSHDRRPLLRAWVRPHGESPDPLFALLAGDISPPTVFNLGHRGWSPTVQLTSLLRARPVPGWLRVHVGARWVAGGWFDEDATVIDTAGRLVCQARQLALLPRLP